MSNPQTAARHGRSRHSSTKWDTTTRRLLSTVQTNGFRIYPKEGRNEWHEYHVKIYPMKRVLVKDEQGNVKEVKFEHKTRTSVQNDLHSSNPSTGEVTQEPGASVEYVTIRNEKSSPFTRRVVKTLLKANEKLRIVADGSDKAYARQPLQTLEYTVAVRKQCEEDDPDAAFIKIQQVQVAFKHIAVIDFTADRTKIAPEINRDLQYQSIEHVTNMALRHGLLQNLSAYKLAPRQFFLPMDDQHNEVIVGKKLAMPVHGAHQPKGAMGIKATATMTQNNQLVMNVNVGTGQVFPNGRRSKQTMPNGFKLLSDDNRTFVGVPIPSLKDHIPERLQSEIEEKLNGYVMEMYYERPASWQQNNPIIWEPQTHDFKLKDDPTKITVATFYKRVYDIQLKFPKMPLIRVSEKEYFPAEFLYQGENEAPKSNSAEWIARTLAFNDVFAGAEKIEKIRTTLSGSDGGPNIAQGIEKAMANLELGYDLRPLSFPAQVLDPPRLEFGMGSVVSDIPDGSWLMKDKTFACASHIYNYAVLKHASISNSDMDRLFHGMDRACQNAKMSSVKRFFRDWRDVTVEVEESQWKEPFNGAREKARAHFLPYHAVLVRNQWTKGMEEVRECLLLPYNEARQEWQAIPLDEKPFCAFDKRDPEKSALVTATLMRIGGERIRGPYSGRFEIDASRKTLRYDSRVICATLTVEEGTSKGLKLDAMEDVALPVVGYSQISCPSIIFVVLPTRCSKARYDDLKAQNDPLVETQSQVIIMDKYKNQGRGENAYLGNIAIKLNTKLSTRFDNGSAWNVCETIPGILLMGYTVTAEAGQSGVMVVSACCTLGANKLHFGHTLRAQKKEALVSARVVKDILQSLFIHYVRSNGFKPKRVVVYRNGGNETQFEDILRQEVDALSDAVREKYSSNERQADVTFVLAQSNHNLVVVPDLMYPWQQYSDAESRTYYSNSHIGNSQWEKPDRTQNIPRNVPSGCYIDDPSFIPKGRVFAGESYDFLLTAQGGLKGTSKPILYRCLKHDAAGDLPRKDLISLTYHNSFFYGTASKSIRDTSVLRYASRQGGRSLSAILDRKDDLVQVSDPESNTIILKWGNRPTFEILDGFTSTRTDNEGRRVMHEPFFTNLAV